MPPVITGPASPLVHYPLDQITHWLIAKKVHCAQNAAGSTLSNSRTLDDFDHRLPSAPLDDFDHCLPSAPLAHKQTN